jgi:hypothetical protein
MEVHMAKALENIPEFLQHGDEDLIELGRKFADALERQDLHSGDEEKGLGTDNWGDAVSDASDCCEAALKLRPTTLLGLRIKAWMTLYELRTMETVMPDNERDLDERLVRSLLADLVPESNRQFTSCRIMEAA